MTHHTAKANLDKGFSWPPEAKANRLLHIGGLVVSIDPSYLSHTLDLIPDANGG